MIRSIDSVYSSNRNYINALAKEKSLEFNQEDLERIQQKAKDLHWLSSVDENPLPLRPKEFHIKEVPKDFSQEESSEYV